MQQQTCIIIGAGISGLRAAKSIAPFFNVIILEAQERIGGRIHTLIKGGQVIEAGASFVHGDLPVTMGLLKEAGIDYVKTSGERYRKEKDTLVQADEVTVGWDALMDKMGEITTDITLQELLNLYFHEPKYAALRKQVSSFTEGFDLADLNRISVMAFTRNGIAMMTPTTTYPADMGNWQSTCRNSWLVLM